MREIVDLLLDLETRLQIQTKLNEANGQLQNIISQPQQPSFQAQFSSTVEQLRGAGAHICEKLQPTQISLIDEIGGKKFFVVDLAGLIDDWVQKNGVTPAVTQQKLQQLVGERQNYIDQITGLRDSLKAVGIETTALVPGDAEIGILLPRELFKNELGWTPEQIAGWLKAGNERGLRALGFEAIYAFIYRAARKGEFLWRYLTRRHKRRRPRRARPSRDTIKDRASIHDRPKDIEARADIGHWEGDLIICKRTRPMLVLHERKSRVMLAARLTGKTAAETISVMLAVFGRINPALRKSITFDNDTAFAQHTLLRTMRDMATWFCDAYASWQKGGVENANGRLRRWLPRHIDIDRLSDEEIQDIVITANLTPRKCLGFKTPFQGILKELGKDVQIRFS